MLALGVNDLKNVNSYITYYKKLIKEFPKTKFYVLSVNPVNERSADTALRILRLSLLIKDVCGISQQVCEYIQADEAGRVWYKGWPALSGSRLSEAVMRRYK